MATKKPPFSKWERRFDVFMRLRRHTTYQSRGKPMIFPKANVLVVISTLIFKIEGTLTATGTKPRPQQDPGKMATCNNAPVLALLTVNSGDFPIGVQLKYSSPAFP